MRNKSNSLKGFTLIEVIIVLAIFSVLVTAVFGIFTYSIRIQRYSLASQQLLSDTSYAMEYMGRMIRMAKKNTGDGSEPAFCINEGSNYSLDGALTSIKFIKAQVFEGTKEKKCISFELFGNRIVQLDDEAAYLTPANIKVNYLIFNVVGSGQTDLLQPKVTIFISAEIEIPGDNPKVVIQTTVSQRDLDLEE